MTESSATALSVQLSSVDPTWHMALRVWWSWQWRTSIAGLLLSWFVNFWIGMLGGSVGMTYRGLIISTQTASFIVMALVGLYFFKDVLDREFRGFRVCIVPKETSPGA